MAAKKRVAALIPVRGGSKSIPLKNIKPIAGKPLVHWVVEAAINAGKIDQVFVMTDSEQIARSVENNIESPKLKIIGRSENTATDTASTESALLEFCAAYPEFDDVVLIQATSPLLTSADLDEGYAKLKRGFDSVISVVRQKRFIWNENGEPQNYDYTHRPRRQEFDGYFVENGAFYISSRKNIIKNKNRISGDVGLYEMPEETYFELDEEVDWLVIEQFLKRKNPDHGRRNTKQIKMVMMDVDGVLTDAGMYYTESGDEFKKFSTYDGMAVQILRERGIKTAFITSENVQLVKRRAEKLKIDHLYMGIKDKLKTAQEICAAEGITLDECAYIGDDINDLELLRAVGMAACPNNAVNTVKTVPGIIRLGTKGGSGAVRSFVKYVLGEVMPNEVAYSRNHLVTLKPWGKFETLEEQGGFKVKRIIVNPGASLSLQMHHHRAEHWTVVQGVAKVTIDKKVIELKVDESCYIPLGAKHRLENAYDTPLEVIEVQTGGYLEEDDIIRFEDRYGRVNEKAKSN